MLTDLWDSHGTAVAYIDDDRESIYLQDGTPVAWLSGSTLYTFRGRLLGWFWQGWVFGRDGKCVLFTERAQPGAPRPFPRTPDARGDKGLQPSRAVHEPVRKRPGRLAVWSGADIRAFFAE